MSERYPRPSHQRAELYRYVIFFPPFHERSTIQLGIYEFRHESGSHSRWQRRSCVNSVYAICRDPFSHNLRARACATSSPLRFCLSLIVQVLSPRGEIYTQTWLICPSAAPIIPNPGKGTYACICTSAAPHHLHLLHPCFLSNPYNHSTTLRVINIASVVSHRRFRAPQQSSTIPSRPPAPTPECIHAVYRFDRGWC